MILTSYIGDAKIFSVPLRWGNKPFEPGEEWFLIFTVKADVNDTDEEAKIQKTTDLGIMVSGSRASIELAPIDTAGDPEGDPIIPALTEDTYVFGVKAQSVDDLADIRTVASGRLDLKQPVGQGTETAVPVYVAEPPLRYDTQLVTYS